MSRMICPRCKYENQSIATYCSNCGDKLTVGKEHDYNKSVRSISLFFFTLLAYIAVLHFTYLGDSYISVLIADSIFAIIILIFFIADFRKNKNLLRVRKFSVNVLWKCVLFAPVAAVAVHLFADLINQSVFDKSERIYYNEFADSPAPLLLSIISIGVFPAVFEELAFRGILFNESLKMTGLKPTIFLTSILFTILHLSLISALWMFPGALLFGYLRAKYKTIFYGMIIHFMYNTSIVLLQLLQG